MPVAPGESPGANDAFGALPAACRRRYRPRVNGWHTPRPRHDWALFLDVDGTLLEFVDDPGAVRAGSGLVDVLDALARALDGALALVSGRSLAQLDRVFPDLSVSAAGLHGLERRGAAGVESSAVALPSHVRAALRDLASRHPALRIEDKGAAIAVHWREAPALEPAATATLRRLADALGPGWQLQPGACVLELKPALRTKADAVRAFLAEPPFVGRRPVYVGDDLTDLDGFATVEALGGDAIAVGPRVAARWSLPDPASVRDWLACVRAALGSPPGACAGGGA
ncbi:MAG: trehalose-phosphatase [Pseudomonadota bacterium]